MEKMIERKQNNQKALWQNQNNHDTTFRVVAVL
jgi:hypothetical protein